MSQLQTLANSQTTSQKPISKGIRDAVDQLARRIEKFCFFSDKFSSFLFSNGRHEQFNNHAIITDASIGKNNFSLIMSGVAQIIARSKNGSATIRLLDTKSFILPSALTGDCYIQALGQVETLSVSGIDFENFIREDNDMQKAISWLTYHELLEIEMSNTITRIRPLKDRLNYFRLTHPDYESKIPLKNIASYLGMSNATLSRLTKT